MKNTTKIFLVLFVAALNFENANAQTLSFTHSPSTVYVGDEVTFTNTSTGFTSSIHQFTWGFGDGYVPNAFLDPYDVAEYADTTDTISENTRHTYYSQGLHTVTLYSLDNSGTPIYIQEEVLVLPAATPPLGCTNTVPPCDLIYNGKFEEFTPCPSDVELTMSTPPYYYAHGGLNLGGNGNFCRPPVTCNWYRAGGTPDFFVTNSCVFSCGPCFPGPCNDLSCPPHLAPNWVPNNFTGCQNDFTSGNVAYTGVFAYRSGTPNNREYIQQHMAQPLVAGRCYRIKFYAALSQHSGRKITSGLSAGFTLVPLIAPPPPNVNSFQILNIPPNRRITAPTLQNNYTWQLITGIYTAIGGEEYITIGNFETDANSVQSANTAQTACYSPYTLTTADNAVAYYYIDNVSIEPAIDVSPSVQICLGGQATLTAVCTTGFTSITWSPATGLNTTSGPVVIASPTSTTTYTVTGTDASGCAVSATVTVTVIVPPATASSNSPLCVGQTINLQSSGGTSYSWTGPNGFSSTLQNPSITGATTSMSGTYTVTVTDANGCTATATTTVTVNTIPVVIVSSNVTICSGQSTTLTASGATTYTWSPPTNLSSTTGASVNANPTTTTTYTVTGMTNGCTATAQVTVTVNPNPTVTVNSSAAGYCTGSGGNVTLTAAGASTYSWSPGTSLSSTTGAVVTANPSATTTYTVTGTDANGCSATATVTVNVWVVTATASSNSPVCEGSTIQLNSGASGGSSPYSFSWTGPNSYSSTLQNPSIVSATTNMTGTYTVTVTDANGCTGTATTSVTVNLVPVVTVSSNVSICAGDPPLTLTASGANTYTWSPATGLSATTGASVTANPSATTTYTVTGTSNGCTATAQVTVTVNPIPTVTFTPNNWDLCDGQSATLCPIVNGAPCPTTGYSYQWSNSANTNQVVVTPFPAPFAYLYTVTVTDVNGCSNTAQVSVVVYEVPVVTVSPDITLCEGIPTVLTASGANTYSWSPCGSPPCTSSTLSVTPTSTTTYTVTGTNTYNCTASATVTVTINPNPVPVVTGFQNNCEMFDLITHLPVNTLYQVQGASASSTYDWWVYGVAGTGIPTVFPVTGTSLSLDYQGSTFVSANAGSVCVYETDVNGCFGEICIPIYPCCGACAGITGASVEITNLSASDVLNPSANSQFGFQPIMNYANKTMDPTLSPPAPNIVVNGNFIIDDDFTFEDCHAICFGANARITVKTGYTLTLRYDTEPNSLWAGCGIMWDGIFLEDDNAHLVITGNGTPAVGDYNAMIQDAKNTVVSDNGGDFNITYADLFNNNYDIIANAYSTTTHAGYVAGSWFHCNNPLSGNPLLPYYPQYQQMQPATLQLQLGLIHTKVGITLNDVLWSKIGDGTSAPLQNIFEFMETGIYATRSSLSSLNNRFQHIRDITPPVFNQPFAPEGYCIASVRVDGQQNSTLVGGNNNADDRNIFDDSDVGVFTIGGTQYNVITHNEFTNLNSGVYIAHSSTNHGFTDMFINDNTFDQFVRGIYTLNNRSADIEIARNTFNAIYPVTQLSTAITAVEPLGNTGPHLNIHHNDMFRVTTGIHTSNERNSNYGSLIDANNIYFDFNHPLITSYGLKLRNSYKMMAQYNSVYRCSTGFTPPAMGMNTFVPVLYPDLQYTPNGYLNSASNPAYSYLTGISNEMGSYNSVFNNYVGYLGSGIRCFNSPAAQFFDCNVMGYNQVGFWLDNSPLQFAPGEQGTSAQASDNRWNISQSSAFTPYADVYAPPPSFTGELWFTQDASGNRPFSTNVQDPLNTVVFTPGTSNPNCSYTIPSIIGDDRMQLELVNILEQIKQPDCPLSEEAKFYTQLDVYIELMYNPGLMNLGNSNDAILQEFYDEASQGPIGEMANVKFEMGEQDWDGAESANSTITPENIAEENDKTVNEIYLETWAMEDYMFTQEQYDALLAIAEQSPITGGPAVYSARVMLGIDFEDYGPPQEGSRLANADSKQPQYIHVYPNPASNELHIEYSLDENETGILTVTDLLGREIITEKLLSDKKMATISTSDVKEGVYFLQVKVNGELIGSQKLLIAR